MTQALLEQGLKCRPLVYSGHVMLPGHMPMTQVGMAGKAWAVLTQSPPAVPRPSGVGG